VASALAVSAQLDSDLGSDSEVPGKASDWLRASIGCQPLGQSTAARGGALSSMVDSAGTMSRA
jgi:hypothetical protein